jgi:hypothetical protein
MKLLSIIIISLFTINSFAQVSDTAELDKFKEQMKNKMSEVFGGQFEIHPPDSSFNCTMRNCYYSEIHNSKIFLMNSPKSFEQMLIDLDKDEKKSGAKSYPITINGVDTRYQEFEVIDDETSKITIGQTYLLVNGENTIMVSVSFPKEKREELEVKIKESLKTITVK